MIKIGSVGRAYRAAVCPPTTTANCSSRAITSSAGTELMTRPLPRRSPRTVGCAQGDLGHVDEDGYVWVTGRKKELIVTAGGKDVAPAILEDRLRGHPLVSQVVVVGDQRPFIGALVTLAEMLPAWLKNHGMEPMSATDAASDPAGARLD